MKPAHSNGVAAGGEHDGSPPAATGRQPLRQGHFWIPGDWLELAHGTVQRGPMFVQWHAPPVVTRPDPLVLVHGGGGQGTDWLDTPDGRPGWAHRFAEAGFAVYVVDRCGHGRSPYHPGVLGPMGQQFSSEAAQALFWPEHARQAHTEWTYGRSMDSDGVQQFMAGMGPLPADLEASQRLDADRLARLLDRVGPAVLVTHSAGGPVGWLTADRRPRLVTAIAAIEPLGPAFVDFPGIGTLTWGLTAAPITYDPLRHQPPTPEVASSRELRVPALADMPIAVVSSDTSPLSPSAQPVAAFLATAGAHAQQLHLPEYGITGNGHALILEANSDRTLGPVRDWIEQHTSSPKVG